MFDQDYPIIAKWVQEHGWIEIGADDCRSSLIRVLDPGGNVWESKSKYPNLDAALKECEQAISDWMEENC